MGMSQEYGKPVNLLRYASQLSIFLSLLLVNQTARGIFLGTAGGCTWDNVNHEWTESEVDGCKTCKCTTLGGDLFEECRTVMRPTAWPSECDRIRRGCEYIIRMKSNPNKECPGWAFTSYIYWVRVSGYSWDNGVRVDGTRRRVVSEPHPDFDDSQSTVVLVPSRPGIATGPTDQTSMVPLNTTAAVVQIVSPSPLEPSRQRKNKLRCRKRPKSKRCRNKNKKNKKRKKRKRGRKNRKSNRTAGLLGKRSAPDVST
ncbi:uncharacterized protein LOC100185151 [Ciona intestinalis]